MNEISIMNIKNTLLVDSRLLSNYLDHRHRTILENIDKYKDEFNSINELTFRTEAGYNNSVVRYALLTEDQCFFLLTLMRNNDRVVPLKLKLVIAFRDARNQLAQRDIARIDGKHVRKMETRAINDLIDYAKAQGSKSAEMYYANITKMVNKIIGIEAGQRDKLDAKTLAKISIAENVVQIAISDGISAGLEYKEIYQLCKNRVEMTIGVNIMLE